MTVLVAIIVIAIPTVLSILIYKEQEKREREARLESAKKRERRQQVMKYVADNSPLIADIHELANQYPVNWRLRQKYSHLFSVNSKQSFDNFNFEQRIQNWVDQNYATCTFIYQTAKQNESNWDAFLYNLDEEYDYYVPEEILDEIEVSEEEFHAVEEELVTLIKADAPPCDIEMVFGVEYITPKGQTRYSNKETIDVDDLGWYIQQVDESRKRMESAAYQRQLMTPKLRYEILRRDNFRCTICGRSERDGIKLHVDHIKPVSQGGKTVIENLRTLCNECNLGKSDSYDPDGVN